MKVVICYAQLGNIVLLHLRRYPYGMRAPLNRVLYTIESGSHEWRDDVIQFITITNVQGLSYRRRDEQYKVTHASNEKTRQIVALHTL